MAINKCCGENPHVLSCDCDSVCCMDCIELIECTLCGRVIYGTDDIQSIERWNNGEDDE